jgi:RHS repeat-associated protein
MRPKDSLQNKTPQITVISYNVLGQKTGMIDPDMGKWKYGYDLGGNLITQTDNIGQMLWFKYDPLNRLIEKRQTNNAGTLLASYTYDVGSNAKGRRTSMSDPSGAASWTYDIRGRVVNDTKFITNAGTFTTSFGYDAMDRVLTTTYPTGEVVTQTYNAMGALENLNSDTYNQWYAKNIDYNANGSIAKLDLGNGLSTLYGYFGFTANQWDARPGLGLTSFGRLWRTRIEAPSGQPLQDLRYSYDSVGNITYINDLARAITGTIVPTMTSAFTDTAAWTLSGNVVIPYIDSGNTVAAITRTGSVYTDNLVRNQYTLVSGSGAQVKFKTNNANSDFVIGIENNDTTNRRLAIYADGTGHVRVQYNDGATATSWRYPVVLTPTIQANVWYTLTFLVDDVRGNTLEVYTSTTGIHYTYNIGLSSGKQWRFHAWVGTNTLYLDDYKEFKSGVVVTPDDRMYFSYDSLDRLITATVTGAITGTYNEAYAFNQIGNITNTTRLPNYKYGLKPHAVLTAGNNLYSYDGNGNMLTRIEVTGSPRITYTQGWDSENRLTTVTNTATSPNSISRFVYDGDGSRVMQVNISGTQIITTAYAGAIEVQITATQRITKAYYSAGSQLIAMRVITASGSALYFMSSDHLGSASLTTDASGGFVARQKFDAWRNVRAAASSGSMGTDISFTGQRSDSGTNLVFMNARFYSSVSGRFVSADTIVPKPNNPQSSNRYSYGLNNPLKYIDPSGHCDAKADRKTDPCWIQHNQIANQLGYIPDGLDAWQTPQLADLFAWMTAGIQFSYSNGAGKWSAANFGDALTALGLVSGKLGSRTLSLLGLKGGHHLTLEKVVTNQYNGLTNYGDIIYLNMSAFHYDNYIDVTIHELGHVIDWTVSGGRIGHTNPNRAGDYWSEVSYEWSSATSWRQNPDSGAWRQSDLKGAASGYGLNAPAEDFAETFTWFVDGGMHYTNGALNQPSEARREALNVALFSQ